jgi:hypothetical protein
LILHHDNAPTYPSLRVSQFSPGKGISAIDHTPDSPDLAPADFWLSPGNRFSDMRTLYHLLKKLTDIPVQDFKTRSEQWPKSWEHRKEVEGD